MKSILVPLVLAALVSACATPPAAPGGATAAQAAQVNDGKSLVDDLRDIQPRTR